MFMVTRYNHNLKLMTFRVKRGTSGNGNAMNRLRRVVTNAVSATKNENIL